MPAKSLALEYQGEQHFRDHYIYGSVIEQQKRDKEKREACSQVEFQINPSKNIKENISLIEIPYWWDRTVLR